MFFSSNKFCIFMKISFTVLAAKHIAEHDYARLFLDVLLFLFYHTLQNNDKGNPKDPDDEDFNFLKSKHRKW